MFLCLFLVLNLSDLIGMGSKLKFVKSFRSLLRFFTSLRYCSFDYFLVLLLRIDSVKTVVYYGSTSRFYLLLLVP